VHPSIFSSAAIAAFIPLTPAAAQQTAADPSLDASSATATGGGAAAAAADPVPGDAAKAHPDTDQAIVVTGVRRSAGDILGGVSVLDKEMLTH